MPRHTGLAISTMSDFLAYEARVDQSVCGFAFESDPETRLAAEGAHDPTPTYYFVLEELFRHYAFNERSHLLDVGCGTGRVLAHYLLEGYPGEVTGIELDPQLASVARAWTSRHRNVHVLQGNVLDLDLGQFTDFYLFNPFDQGILQRFIQAVEHQVAHPCILIHMSDNGDSWRYVGRPGWTELASGSFQSYRNARGYQVKVYDSPQHYTVWRYDGSEASQQQWLV